MRLILLPPSGDDDPIYKRILAVGVPLTSRTYSKMLFILLEGTFLLEKMKIKIKWPTVRNMRFQKL